MIVVLHLPWMPLHSQCHQITLIDHASNSRNSPSIQTVEPLFLSYCCTNKRHQAPTTNHAKTKPFLKPKDSPSTFPRSQVRSRSRASIDWRITRSCKISFSTTLKSSSYLAWSKSFLPDWKLEVGTLLFDSLRFGLVLPGPSKCHPKHLWCKNYQQTSTSTFPPIIIQVKKGPSHITPY